MLKITVHMSGQKLKIFTGIYWTLEMSREAKKKNLIFLEKSEMKLKSE